MRPCDRDRDRDRERKDEKRERGRSSTARRSRAQANLPALAVAVLLLTAATGLALTVVDGAFASADRDADERRVAATVADRLVAADGPITRRANVLAADRLGRLNATRIDALVPAAADAAFRVRLADRTVVRRGRPVDGTTVHRVVLIERRQPTSVPVRGSRVTLPRRSPRATITIRPVANVSTVRANDRVVLHDRGGLTGEYTIALSRYETTTLSFRGIGVVPSAIEVTYYPARTRKARLTVTVAVDG